MALLAAARADPLAAALTCLPRVQERRLGHDEVCDLALTHKTKLLRRKNICEYVLISIIIIPNKNMQHGSIYSL